MSNETEVPPHSARIIKIKKMILNNNVSKSSINYPEYVSYSKCNLQTNEESYVVPKIKHSFNENPGPGQYDIVSDNVKQYSHPNSANQNCSTVNSDYRVVSIPTKEQQYGYEIDKNGGIKMSHSPFDLLNNKGASHARKKSGKIIHSAYKPNSAKYTNDQTVASDSRNDISSLSRKISCSSNSRLQSSKTEAQINNDNVVVNHQGVQTAPQQEQLRKGPAKFDKSKIYRSLYVGKSHQKVYTNIIDELLNSSFFAGTPGPGYYSPVDLHNQQYANLLNIEKFGSNFPRICALDANGNSAIAYKDTTPGPGRYNYIGMNIEDILKDNKENIYRPKIGKVTQPNKGTIKQLKKLKEKETQLLGPGKYNVDKNNYIKESKNKNYSNFGAYEMRFNNIAYKIDEDIPGPGIYDITKNYSVELSKKKIPKVLKELTVMVNHEEDSHKNEVPPVGTYNPGLSKSIEYSLKLKELNRVPIVKKNKKILKEEKEIKERIQKMKLKQLEIDQGLGPGCYFNNHQRQYSYSGSKAPFNTSASRDQGGCLQISKDNSCNMEPIEENDINKYHQWIKKTYNINYA